MKLIIAGGRDVPEKDADALVRKVLSKYVPDISKVWAIFNGGASGIDAAVRRVWRQHIRDLWPQVGLVTYEADWETHGKKAGPMRNREMAKHADTLIAIWDGKSRGTKNMIDVARKAGLKIHIEPYE
jgi:hypothetical protein